MSDIIRIQKEIAVSLFLGPCTLKELKDRDFLKSKSQWGVNMLIGLLEKKGAIYYKGNIIHTRKKWAKENLHEWDLDFRSEKEKEQAGWTKFKKDIVNKYGL